MVSAPGPAIDRLCGVGTVLFLLGAAVSPIGK